MHFDDFDLVSSSGVNSNWPNQWLDFYNNYVYVLRSVSLTRNQYYSHDTDMAYPSSQYCRLLPMPPGFCSSPNGKE